MTRAMAFVQDLHPGPLLCPTDALPPPLLSRARVLVLAATAIPTEGDVM